MAINRHTIEAVHRQLRAMASASYDIGIVRFLDDGRKLKLSVGVVSCQADVDELLPKLVRQNARDENIFIRPELLLDRALILIDDIEEMDVDKLRDHGLEPCCVCETSPKNLQAWIDFGPEPMPLQERKVLAVWLAGFVDGDMGSADGQHYGRLAGFTNRKPKHFGSGRNGGFPFVLCQYAEPCVCSKAQGARSWAREQAKAIAAQRVSAFCAGGNRTGVSDVFRRYCAYWEQNLDHKLRKDGSSDLSYRDFAVASRMLKERFDPAAIIEALTASAGRKSNPAAYAKCTVEAALNRL